jgi:hypothetical protein
MRKRRKRERESDNVFYVTFLVSPVACGIARALRVRCDGAGKGYAVTHGAIGHAASPAVEAAR